MMTSEIIGIVCVSLFFYLVIGLLTMAIFDKIDGFQPITVLTRIVFWFPLLVRDMCREAWRIFRHE